MSAIGPSNPRGALTPFGHSATLSSADSGTNLADVLERVLDKGVVIAGDIQINLLDIELLTIKLRLVVASVDTARRMGIRWWETDPMLAGGDSEQDRKSLSERVQRLERELEQGDGPGTAGHD
jgi:Gas vesicle protein